MRRRDFLGAVTGAVVLGAQRARAVGAESAVPPPPVVTLGATGIRTSRLALGTGIKGGKKISNMSKAGFAEAVKLFRHAYERGVTFYDMADMYGTHPYCREALRDIPRDRVTLMTKLWWRYDGKPEEVPHAVQKHSSTLAVNRFLEELAVQTIDIVLVHCATAEKWDGELAGQIEGLQAAKAAGKIRALGVSCHTLEALARAAELPWVEVVFSRINPEGVKMDAAVEAVLPVHRRIRENGKALVGMKIYGEGKLADQRERCMKYAQGLGTLHAMSIGCETVEQIDDNLRLMAKYPAV